MPWPTSIGDDLRNWFRYHAPLPGQGSIYNAIRRAGHDFASVLLDCCPDSDDARKAIDLIRSAVFWANASVACEEPKAYAASARSVLFSGEAKDGPNAELQQFRNNADPGRQCFEAQAATQMATELYEDTRAKRMEELKAKGRQPDVEAWDLHLTREQRDVILAGAECRAGAASIAELRVYREIADSLDEPDLSVKLTEELKKRGRDMPLS